ncbi:MAG TPA: DNA-binding protein [Planctomycetes bacterium]|nr:DNA-binding protein [Planctomycetota bacterium]
MKSPRDVIEQCKAVTALKEGRALTAEPKRDRRSQIPPDYVSAETLAQRLDCSKTTVHAYVRRGILPRPLRIGELVRWRWTDIDAAIESFTAGTDSDAHDANDPYLAGLERGEATEADN